MDTDARNKDWNVAPGPDGSFPDSQVTHAILIDVRAELRTLRKIGMFFVWVFVISVVVGILVAASRL